MYKEIPVIQKSIDILLPYLDVALDAKAYSHIWASIAKDYNDHQDERNSEMDSLKHETGVAIPKMQKLRGTHRETFWFLLRSYQHQLTNLASIYSDMPEALSINKNKPPSLYTSRSAFAQQTGKDGSTFYRHIERLLEAGIVLKRVNHGQLRPFELFLNPDILLIRDAKQTDYTPSSKYLKETENQALRKGVSAKSTVIQDSTRTFKKENKEEEKVVNNSFDQKPCENITAGVVERIINDTLTQEHSQEQHKNKGELNDNQEKKQDDRKILSFTEQDRRALALRYQLNLAMVIFKYAIEKLWKGGKLWENNEIATPEVQRTVELIWKQWFSRIRSNADADMTLNRLQETIDLTARYIQRKKFTNWYVYPYLWFDLQYAKGISGALKWNLKAKAHRFEAKQLSEDRKKMYDYVHDYFKYPNFHNYIKILERAKEKLPEDMLNEFCRLTNINQNTINQNIKKSINKN